MRPLRRSSAAFMALLPALALAACASPRAADGPPGPPSLLSCPGSSFFPRTEWIVVPDGGGTVRFGNGHALEFRPGALPAGTRLVVSRALTSAAAVSIEPAQGPLPPLGAPVVLTLNYAPCDAPPAPGGSSYLIFRVAPADGALQAVGGTDAGRRVTATLESFSVYAIGAN